MGRFGHMFPEGIEDIEDLVELPGASRQSRWRRCSRACRRTCDASSRTRCAPCCGTTTCRWSSCRWPTSSEQITGRPLGRRYPFSGRRAHRPGRCDGPHAQPGRGRRAGAPASPGDARHGLRPHRRVAGRELLGPEAAASWKSYAASASCSKKPAWPSSGGRDVELTAKASVASASAPCATCSPSCGKDRTGQHDACSARRRQRAGNRDQAMGVRRPVPRRHRHDASATP